MCIALIVLAGIGGCVDQKREVAIYTKQLDALPGSAAPAPDDAPLSLQQALRLAEKNDESVALKGEAYLQALIAKDIAVSALLPQISISPVLKVADLGVPNRSHSFAASGGINTNVFDVQDEAKIEQAGLTAEQSRQLLLDEQQTVLVLTADDYYAVLQAERSVVVDENSLAEQDERVRQATAQLNAGNGTRLAVAQSESQASATRVELIAAQALVTTSRAALEFLIGIPLGDRPLTDQYDPPTDELRSVEDWLADADAHRQDLIAAASAVEAARQGVRAAIAEYIPTVTLGISHTIYMDGSHSLQQPWTAALSANIPIFTGGQIEGDVRTAFSNLRSAVLSQSQTRKQVESDIRTDYANLISSRRQVKELKVELAASRDALVYAQQQFNVGLAINLDVLTAQDNLLSTQLALATQEYQEKIAYLDLLRVDGQLTFAAAAPPQHPSTEPSEMEFTTPNVVQYTTAPSTAP